MFAGKISLTGVKPTGTPHLGNLLGAFMPVVNMAENGGEEREKIFSIFFVFQPFFKT